VIGRVIESYAKRSATAWSASSPATASDVVPQRLIVPHYDDAAYDDEIQVGMTFTIEPMLNLGTHEWVMWDDGWTVVTATAGAAPSSSTLCW
jgi:methionyl aminopeptidase